MFYRNRLVFLSSDNVILSQSGDYYNFWSTTATTISDGDVIDITASSHQPTVLYDGVETPAGLLVFSPYEQFMVTTEEVALTPKSGRIQYVSSYDYNIGVKPFSLGTSVGFTSNSGLKSRFWQLAAPSRTAPPTIIEQSKAVANSLPRNFLEAAHSRDNNIVLFKAWDDTVLVHSPCEDPYDTIWGYRYFSDGQNLLQSAWFKWKFFGQVIWHTIMSNTYYVIVYHNSKANLIAIDLESQTNTYDINDTNVCERRLIHLDNSVDIKAGTYNATTNLTTFEIKNVANKVIESHRRQPTTQGSTSGGQQVIYCRSGPKKGEVAVVPAFTANAVSSFDLVGDWSGSGTYNTNTQLYPTGNTCTIGLTYDMEVEFPAVYVTKPVGDSHVADLTSNLNIHRSTFNFGPTGSFSTVLQRKGRSDYIQTHEASNNHTFKFNQYNILSDTSTTVPIYSDNKDYIIKILSTHPTPCTLHSQTWEGSYTPNYYQRA